MTVTVEDITQVKVEPEVEVTTTTTDASTTTPDSSSSPVIPVATVAPSTTNSESEPSSSSSSTSQGQGQEGPDSTTPAAPADSTFSDFFSQLEDYNPTLPDSVANYLLQASGFNTSDPQMSRLISTATQKYMSDIINDTFTQCKLRAQPAPVGNKTKVKVVKKYSLTMEDLNPVLNDYGITVKKPPYYV